MRVALKVRFECPHVTCILWNGRLVRFRDELYPQPNLSRCPTLCDPFQVSTSLHSHSLPPNNPRKPSRRRRIRLKIGQIQIRKDFLHFPSQVLRPSALDLAEVGLGPAVLCELLVLLGLLVQDVLAEGQTLHLCGPGKVEEQGEGEAGRGAGDWSYDAVGAGFVDAVGELVEHVADLESVSSVCHKMGMGDLGTYC